MEPRTYWQNYITRTGGLTAVAARLAIPYPTIAAISNGRRGIGVRLAQRMERADNTLDATVLVWVRPLVPMAAPAEQAGRVA